MEKIVSFLVVPFLGLVLFSSSAFAAVQTVTLSVPDMYCAACPITVKKALQKVAGVSKVQVSFEKKEAVVMFDDTKTTIKKLQDATPNAGYPSVLKVEKTK